MDKRPRARDLGIAIGALPPGRWNAITDVAGVKVGHVTLVRGEGPLRPGSGPVRTGVTAILPHPGDVFRDKVAAVVHRLNGFGEVTNSEQVREMGVIDSPILLTGTTNVPRVADALLDWAFAHDGEAGISTWSPSPIVAECSDMYLSDVRARPVGGEQVRTAIESAASGPVPEGALGGGTGMSCFEFKGGIGTASRVTPQEAGGFSVGALVMTNFGRRAQMIIDGVPLGRELTDWRPSPPEGNPDQQDSSIIMVLATDAPLDPRQLERLSVRAGAGLARTGGFFSTTSGDFVISFSTTNRVPHFPAAPVIAQHIVAEGPLENRSDWPIPPINWLFQAAAEATEEAILNSLFKAETMIGRDQHVRHALPLEETVRIMQRYGHAEVRLP